MKRFEYTNAKSLAEAAAILKESGGKAKIIAGGTDLLGQMKDNILPHYPEAIVNIKNLPGLDNIEVNGKTLRLGALTRLEDIAGNAAVREKCPLLAEAARLTASPHIREMGTIGGNICQSNRCWYYWVPDNRFNCIRKGNKECFALTGDGRYHSIFGASRVGTTPCASECPAGNDIPTYFSKIREGDLVGAAAALLETDPIPAITGRVCPHTCEGSCNRAGFDEAVSIRGVERYVGDYVLENTAEMYPTPEQETARSIAVVGSGPAGLSAAYYLRKSGHSVIIFESMPEPGGLLIYGIPPYRLPKDVVKAQVKALEDMGVKITLNTRVDRKKLAELQKEYDAVFLACGAWQERPAGIKGEELMLSGAAALRAWNAGSREIPGKKVAVIGGGNVALDVARSLLRLGAEPVIIYRRTRAEMPALKEEVEKADEENIKIELLTLPVEASKEGGKIALTCTRMELGAPDESGRPRPVPVAGSEFTAEYDAVMTAIGEVADTSLVPAEYLDKKGWLKADASTGLLGDNVYAGGDFITGPATVVAAIAAGKKAAATIDKSLGGKGEKNTGEAPSEKLNSAYLKNMARADAPELLLSDRIKTLDAEETATLDFTAVESEANRCFNCGCVACNSSDIAPALIALNARIITTTRVIPADDFFTVNFDRTTVLADDEIVIGIEVPLPGAGSRGAFSKFALRQSIDFPIVNCAVAVETEKGKVKSARICLNAVHTLPYRVREAEEYLSGKPINEVNAKEASNFVVKNAVPLVNNQYKIQIAKALVKRTVLACQSEKS